MLLGEQDFFSKKQRTAQNNGQQKQSKLSGNIAQWLKALGNKAVAVMNVTVQSVPFSPTRKMLQHVL